MGLSTRPQQRPAGFCILTRTLLRCGPSPECHTHAKRWKGRKLETSDWPGDGRAPRSNLQECTRRWIPGYSQSGSHLALLYKALMATQRSRVKRQAKIEQRPNQRTACEAGTGCTAGDNVT
uniref:Uncharacterized protein n=1 Tax=Sphaerodactylus townsendi TaxID=933632 RepID=A0ACB8EHM5_9SAUR